MIEMMRSLKISNFFVCQIRNRLIVFLWVQRVKIAARFLYYIVRFEKNILITASSETKWKMARRFCKQTKCCISDFTRFYFISSRINFIIFTNKKTSEASAKWTRPHDYGHLWECIRINGTAIDLRALKETMYFARALPAHAAF